MKIVIVDDQLNRYRTFKDEIINLGISQDSLFFFNNVEAAENFLTSNGCDLLILDILLPYSNFSEPDSKTSLDFLFEIHQGTELNKPLKIIGLTADKSINNKVIETFSAYTWNVVEYDATDDNWKAQIKTCIEYILSNTRDDSYINNVSGNCDVLIVCALEEPELKSVLEIPWDWGISRPADDIHFVHDGAFISNEIKFTVCATFASRMGMISTALKTSALIKLLSPKLIVMTGICAGVKGKTELGDVIFSDPVWDWQSGKRVKDKENSKFSISPHQIPSDLIVRTHIEQLRSDRKGLNEIWKNSTLSCAKEFKIVIGPMASGSAVLADGKVIEEIKIQHRDLVGVEMEAYGLYAAAKNSSLPQPLCCVLKAVCDFADESKNDEFQEYASYTSAQTLKLLLEKFAFRILK
ncbi:hypothetical protein [Klebsiella pneumoniae]|uniref:5'-methylthioadenosine/S-adenosylhomocysteine nucleosidase family protein n=1 Tax=Klebsiella pneumoniae TaxID=573 RepID=UPI0037532726